MTLRAYLITMRGRIREALVPELQVLRDRLAYEAAFNNRLCQHCEKVEADARAWQAIAIAAIERADANHRDARRPLTDEEICGIAGERAHKITGGNDE
jgi:hypothetical protein